MSWLTNHMIKRVIKRNADFQTRQAFLNIFPINKLPRQIKNYPIFLVVNTHTDNLSGEHWFTIFISRKGIGEIFDSAAQPVQRNVQRWMNQFCRKWSRNRLSYQAPLSSLCGAYAIYYILNRLHYPSMQSLLAPYQRKPIDDHFILNYYQHLQK